MHGLIKLARPGHWIKNSVVLAALFFAGVANNSQSVLLALAAAGVFCLLSSAIYTLNDIIDREQDKKHPLKKSRPLASGEISIAQATIFLVALTILGFLGARIIGQHLFMISALFFILNVLYSIWLKHIVILDVMAIALGFVLRAYAGAAAIEVPASKWMLINTLFLALFLGLGKRRHELLLLEEDATAHRKILDKYSPYLLDQLIGVVTATIVVAYMLYSFSSEVSEKLGTEYLYLTVPFVVYGIFRYLYLIHKEDEGGSPTRVLISDKPLLINIILWLIIVIAILYWI
jgi:4-hydroxybenzoate polyprenyltransferase